MPATGSLYSRVLSLALAAVLAIAGFALAGIVAPTAAAAGPGPVINPTPTMVKGDALPTVQIDGVVWSQAIVGNTVYVGGDFKNARPAGSAPGQNLTPRSNLLAYNLTTGALITSFAPSVNAEVKTVVASPDGSRVYIAGAFTSVGGVGRDRIAAFDTATGNLVGSFTPHPWSSVYALAITGNTVYAGGPFTVADGQNRSRLAAFDATTGNLLGWNPTADFTVHALVLTPDNSKLIVGGAFAKINNATAGGLGAVDPTTGALLPWQANSVVRNSGNEAAILSLKTDGVKVYGTGYDFGGGGTLEGTFAADPNSGVLSWVEDCHGDTYDSYPVNGIVYTVSHAHYCGNIGGFPQSDPWAINMRHALAFTRDATGTINHDPLGYHDWFGTPSPSLVNWFPEFQPGSYTGITQAAWTVTGNGQYVVMGGEFPTVNGQAQQGLVRFAVAPISPAKQGPKLSGANFKPALVGLASGAVRVAWQSNWDIDDQTLTYSVIRDGQLATPIYQVNADATFWNLPTLGFVDKSVTPGATYTYRIEATDSSGNTSIGDDVTITAPATASASPYAAAVANDGAQTYWRLNEASGSVAIDNLGVNDADEQAGVTHGAAGAIPGDTASTFSGTTTGSMGTRTSVPAPDTFTTEAWVKTTSTSGGRIIGYGDARTGASGYHDRQTYMDNTGKITFGVYTTATNTLTSSKSYNDGQWHQVVSTLGPTGMVLYVDGLRVGSRTDTTAGEPYSGYWRVGGDNLAGWPNLPSSQYLKGAIDDVALYPNALAASQVAAHYVASGRTSLVPPVPVDGYGAAVYNANPDLYWRLADTTGVKAADSGPAVNDGSYVGGVTKGVAGAVPGGNTAVTFNGTNGFAVSNASVANPTVYSVEAWLKTTTTKGGKIIGLGDKNTGVSTNYDRHIYMQDDGKLVFGVYTGVQNKITTAGAYNNGAWHHVVATQASDGMKLYVDGVLAGTNPQTQAQSYTGFWRVGGDTTWGSTSPYFSGTIDEAAVYHSALSAATVNQHFLLGSGTAVNSPPTAAFTATVSNLTVSVDGSTSNDVDGTIPSYAWSYGDGSSGTGKTATHTYAAPGTYTVALTVTDNKGATGTISQPVTVTSAPANQPPVARFTSAAAGLTATVDGSTSTDADGTVDSYLWDFGDAGTATTAVTTHTYAAAGTYTVRLTVTDDKGATGTITHPVTVTAPPPVNSPPTAAFTSAVSNLVVSVNGSTSKDTDGTITSYVWDYGDAASGTGMTATHTYAAAGTYTVRLTVTDNKGATGTITHPVTVTTPNNPTVYASDGFGRTLANGLGSADVGGAWTLSGPTSWFGVNGSGGQFRMNTPGSGPAAFLNSVSATDVDLSVDVSLSKVPSGGATFVTLASRRVGSSDYRLVAIIQPGSTNLQLSKIVNGVETTLSYVGVPNMSYAPGDVFRMRLQAKGSGSTGLVGKVWKVGTAEPATWQATATDSEAVLQAPGGIGLQTYLSGAATNAPQVATLDNLSAKSIPLG